MKRRHLLQLAGSTLAALGINQFDLMRQGDRYGKVLAQSTPRKLALLVGINEYPKGTGWNALNGCITDVQMQKNLLVYGFGFNPDDILIVENQAATRDGILTAFEEHLIKQAKPGDVAVFHYSGHGSKVIDPDGESIDGLNSTFVPIDCPVPVGYPYTEGTVNDIMGHSLFLLMSAVKTENLTVVLDSCHSGGGKRGNLTFRSRDGAGSNDAKLSPSEVELNFQERMRSLLGLSPEDFREARKQIAKGVVIASASRDQFAADVPFGDFSAGAFTYLMTRYLWQQTRSEPVRQVIVNITRSTRSLARTTSSIIQEPEVEFNPEENQQQPLYFFEPQKLPAEAVIVDVQGDRSTLWLGGVDSQSLEAFTQETVFSVMDTSGRDLGGESPLLVQLESRNGLTGYGKILPNGTRGSLQTGMFLQEQIRGIPQDISLNIGLDDRSLNATELAEAKQFLETLPQIKTHPLGHQEVQYIFGRVIDTYLPQLQNSEYSLPAVGSLGLFVPGLDETVPDSFGNPEESIDYAVRRLQAKLTTLSVARILKLILNANSSRLSVEAYLKPAEPTPDLQGIQSTSFTVRGGGNPGQPTRSLETPKIPELKVGTKIQFEVRNHEVDDLYFSVLLIGVDGELALIFPADWTEPEESAVVMGKQSRNVPERGDGFALRVGSTLGVSEALVLASRKPLRTFLKAMQDLAVQQGRDRGPVALNALEVTGVVQKLLNDLRGGVRGALEIEFEPGYNAIDTTQIAAMSIPFHVVPG
jgi:Caspase domain/Domain of unknown function (DUF4384)